MIDHEKLKGGNGWRIPVRNAAPHNSSALGLRHSSQLKKCAHDEKTFIEKRELYKAIVVICYLRDIERFGVALVAGVVQEPARQVAEARAQRHGRTEERLRHAVQRVDATLRRLPLLGVLILQQLGLQGALSAGRQEFPVARREREPAGP